MSTENQDLSEEAFCSCFIALQSWSITQKTSEIITSAVQVSLGGPLHSPFALNASNFWIPSSGAATEVSQGGTNQVKFATRVLGCGGCFLRHVAWIGPQYTSSHYGQICWKTLLWVKGFLWVMFYPPSSWELQSVTSLSSPHAENSSHSTNRTQVPQTWRLSLSKEHYGRIKQTLVNDFHGMLVWYRA